MAHGTSYSFDYVIQSVNIVSHVSMIPELITAIYVKLNTHIRRPDSDHDLG